MAPDGSALPCDRSGACAGGWGVGIVSGDSTTWRTGAPRRPSPEDGEVDEQPVLAKDVRRGRALQLRVRRADHARASVELLVRLPAAAERRRRHAAALLERLRLRGRPDRRGLLPRLARPGPEPRPGLARRVRQAVRRRRADLPLRAPPGPPARARAGGDRRAVHAPVHPVPVPDARHRRRVGRGLRRGVSPRASPTSVRRRLHDALTGLILAERRLHRYYRDGFDRVLRPPLVAAVQALIVAGRARGGGGPAGGGDGPGGG